jgi:hypothetical protein
MRKILVATKKGNVLENYWRKKHNCPQCDNFTGVGEVLEN